MDILWSEICGSNIGDCRGFCLLGSDAMQFNNMLLVFWKNYQPPSSGLRRDKWRWTQQVPPECWWHFALLHVFASSDAPCLKFPTKYVFVHTLARMVHCWLLSEADVQSQGQPCEMCSWLKQFFSKEFQLSCYYHFIITHLSGPVLIGRVISAY
jgi:hypothetical protein